MAIGLSTYAFLWRWSSRVSAPMSLQDMVEGTRDLGCEVFQICDYPQLAALTAEELADLRSAAAELNITLEVGTRGVDSEHLLRYLDICRALDAALLRSMLHTADHKPTVGEAATDLRKVMPAFEKAGVTVALETYEQVATTDLIDVVDAVESDALGVCLDPGNCVAGLELPHQVVERVAPYVKNMHIKDFEFSRQEGWVGFTFAGSPLGEGLLDYDRMVAVVQPQLRGINQIVEHWLPWQGDAEATTLLETQWTEHSVKYLRSKS